MATRRPERVLGLHFFNPAPVMALVEVVSHATTDPALAAAAAATVTAWGKNPVACSDVPGFIVNRVNRPFTLEPLRLLRAGAGTVATIDAALRDAGFPMGPFELMDLVGLDINLATARNLFEAFDRPPRFRPSPIQESLVAAGHLGRKTGEGFYRYDGAGRPMGVSARFASAPGNAALDAGTIAERTILAVVNEAYRALGEKVAAAADIELALRLGANHPFGPFEWAAQTGLAEVAVMLDALTPEDADTFRPAIALLRAAAG
jgi:3-hydroxybutyryl-CoA dehydrogenase